MRDSEERLRLLVDSVQDYIVMLDPTVTAFRALRVGLLLLNYCAGSHCFVEQGRSETERLRGG
jgi:hypothetical protein